jgi:hypothetical protein
MNRVQLVFPAWVLVFFLFPPALPLRSLYSIFRGMVRRRCPYLSLF